MTFTEAFGKAFNAIMEPIARAGAVAGTIAGGREDQPLEPGSKNKRPMVDRPDKAQGVLDAITHSAPVKPGEAVAQTAQGFTGSGSLDFLRGFGIWAVIVAVGLIGLWGLLAPGGGVAIIERARK